MTLECVGIAPLPPERFRALLPEEAWHAFERDRDRARELLRGRVVWNINSTAKGGGVAELLNSLVAYARGAGVDTRWAVIRGDPEFFTITKRIHNHLHGQLGDGGTLGPDERQHYEAVLTDNALDLLEMVTADDIVILHDPQTAGLAGALRGKGNHVVWRCHVGLDLPNDLARAAWGFLSSYVREADSFVFSRQAYEWEGLDTERLVIIPPTIDAFSSKNCDLGTAKVEAILNAAGILVDGAGDASFPRLDGSTGSVVSQARVIEEARLTRADRPILQVSRWDRLKDPLGVLRGFTDHVPARSDVHLVLAGPDVQSVSDDPEGKEVLAEVVAEWMSLAPGVRQRIHLAELSMADSAENAVIVNALQRHAEIVVQKSLAEGFGLTVTEAMWKAKPVVASRVGGIQDQIEEGISGLLVADASDLPAFGAALDRLIVDRELAHRIGHAAHRRVQEHFLGTRSLMAYEHLIERIAARVG